MKRVYIVMGDGGCGKSSLIRHLTGLYKSKTVTIRLATGNDIELFPWIRSEQENTHGKNTPAKTLSDILSRPEDDILIALRIDPINGYPAGIDYINHIAPHCIIQRIAVLYWGAARPITFTQPPGIITHIPSARLNPTNVNAATVRGAWGWL